MSEMNPDWISPPGDTILDIIAENGTTSEGLADMLGMTDEEINRLLRGVMPITKDVANKLQGAIGAPSSFWMRREQQYRDELHRLATSKPELIIREAEVTKLKPEPGEVLVIKISGRADSISQDDMNSLKKGFQSIFPNNQVILLAIPEGAALDLTIAKPSEYPVETKAMCGAVGYCNDCSCGKKAMVEALKKE